MAANLLPLLLVGGAAAYVVTQERKKQEDKAECPPTTTVTLGEMESVAKRAHEKYGNAADPSQEANFYVRELSPEGCNRASVESTFKLQIPDTNESWEITLPDTYMMTFATSLGARTETGKIDLDQAEKFWTRELDWYKKVTGKNFDISTLNLESLLKHLGASMQGALDKLGLKGGSKRPPKNQPKKPEGPMDGGACPATFVYDYDMDEDIRNMAMFEEGRNLHGNDPFKVADFMFSNIVPPGCTKADFESIVNINMHMPGHPTQTAEMDLAAFYASNVMLAAQKLGLGPAKMAMIEDKVKSNYQSLTGKPLHG